MSLRTPFRLVLTVALTVLPSVARAAVAVDMSVASDFQCALDTTGTAFCWGRNDFGQLGTGDNTDRSAPTSVSGLGSGVLSVAVGWLHACAVTAAGGVKCWGSNYNGSLGDGTTTDANAPQDVPGLTSGVAAVSAAGTYACALTTAGSVSCWGAADPFVGSTPTPMDGLESGIVAISVGVGHHCALTSAGGLKCWGSNRYGQAGDGTTVYRSAPVDVSGLTSGVASVSAGGLTTCAVTTAGAAKCWGYNGKGGVGDGTTIDRWVPTTVAGLGSGVASVTTERDADKFDGGNTTCAVTTAGTVWCWSGYTGGPIQESVFASGAARVAPGDRNVWVITTTGEIRTRYGLGYWDGGCVKDFGDADGDELCDVLDTCRTDTDRQWFPYYSPGKMVLTRINVDTVPGNDQMVLKGRFELPAGKQFADLDPATTGARIVLVTPQRLVASFSIPGGTYGGKGTAGWTLKPGAKPRWTFTDATGAPGTRTVTVMKLTDFGPGTVGRVLDLGLTARAGSFPVGPDDFPIEVQVLLDDTTAGANGLCGEGRFHCSCRFGVGGKALNCNTNLRGADVCD